VRKTHSRYDKFLPYGDAKAYRKQEDAVSHAFGDLGEKGK
jgi:hypothetical protein